jgi:peptidyl-prolyl cis-trans isomerase B (cyclophilin B)
VPSEKRARQRAGREVRQAEVDRRAKRRRTYRRIASALVVVAVVILVVVLVSNNKPAKTTSTTTTTAVAAAIAPTCPPVSGSSVRHVRFTKAPPVCIDEHAVYRATVTTDLGTFVITMNAAKSPAAVNNFVFLSRYRFYDTTTFFRVIPSNIIQGGSPSNTDTGGPGYSFTGNTPTGCASHCYPIGSVAMANSGAPSSNGSQFFVVAGAAGTDYPPNYTLFGTVTSGISVVERIAADGNPSAAASGIPPKVTHHIKTVTITEA